MILADKIEYRFRRILTQKHGDCSTHAFLGVMAELVENKTGIPTDFEYYEERKKMGKSFLLMKRIANKAVNTGFKTIDNRLVKASKVITVGRYKDSDELVKKICTNIQKYSPCIAVFNWNASSKTNLIHSKNKVLDRIYKYVRNRNRNDNKAHAISITGFDRQKKLFTLVNSWGEKSSYRYLKFDDLIKIWRSGQFIETVIITKK